MYISLVENNYIKLQPDCNFISVAIKGIRKEFGINQSAQDILELCNGTNSQEDIIDKLCKKYNENYDTVKNFVSQFILQLEDGNVVSYNNNKNLTPCKIKGSKQYYTPEVVVLELTHNCPLKCKHCYLNAGVGDSMNYKTLMNVLEQMIDQGVQCFQLTGGEPFLYEHIDKVIDYLVSKEVKVQVTTSGYILNDKILKCIDKLENVNGLIQISIDGFNESHNFIRGKSDSFEKTIKFLEVIKNKNVQLVVATCIAEQDFKEIEELCIYLKDKGVDLHRIGWVSEQGRANENNIKSNFGSNEIHLLIKELKDKYEDEKFKVGAFEDHNSNNNLNCGLGYRILKVNPSFKLSPCPMISKEIGDINNESLESIYIRNSKIFPSLKSAEEKLCKGCELIDKCKDCIAESIVNYKNVNKCHWYYSEGIKIP